MNNSHKKNMDIIGDYINDLTNNYEKRLLNLPDVGKTPT